VSKVSAALTASDPVEVDLKDPVVAAVLAWLVPGLGHIYQRRTAKGVLFMACILSTFVFGLSISHGHAVYASWTDTEWRLPYLCQVGVGLPALPALAQTYLVRNGRDPLFGGVMAPPRDHAELDEWWKSLNRYFELGTVYTMIAGLLNVLAIYDAWGGPVILPPEEKKARKDDEPPGTG
jgi:hypothetical protein